MSQQVLNAETFAAPAIVGDRTRTMSYGGTMAKSPFLLVLAVGCAIVLYSPTPVTLDFAVIETGVNQQAPKDFEWYGAFGLQTTLVWLYLEILRLLLVLGGNR